MGKFMLFINLVVQTEVDDDTEESQDKAAQKLRSSWNVPDFTIDQVDFDDIEPIEEEPFDDGDEMSVLEATGDDD